MEEEREWEMPLISWSGGARRRIGEGKDIDFDIKKVSGETKKNTEAIREEIHEMHGSSSVYLPLVFSPLTNSYHQLSLPEPLESQSECREKIFSPSFHILELSRVLCWMRPRGYCKQTQNTLEGQRNPLLISSTHLPCARKNRVAKYNSDKTTKILSKMYSPIVVITEKA